MSYPNAPLAGASSALPKEMSAEELYKLAQSQPSAWLGIASHPHAYPDLLSWLERVGPPEVKEAVARRKRGNGPVQPAAPRRPTSDAGANGRPGRPDAGVPAVRQAPPGGFVGRPQSNLRPDAAPGMGSRMESAGPRPSVGPAPGAVRPAPGMPQSAASPNASGAFAPSAGPTAGTVRPAPGMAQPAASAQPAPVLPRTTPSPLSIDDAEDVNQLPAENTVLAKRTKRARSLATVSWDGGDPVSITKEQVVIGRRVPEALRNDQSQVVDVNDPTKTVSAKHARISRVNGQWIIEDLDSTNGIYLVAEDGTEEELLKVGEVTEQFYLGDVAFRWEPKG